MDKGERRKNRRGIRDTAREKDGGASRHTPPEARDANYSGSCEQFVEYSGNVCLIPAGLPAAPRVFTSAANTAAI